MTGFVTRRLAVAAAVGLWLLPTPGLALSLGALSLESARGEPLRASVDVHTRDDTGLRAHVYVIEPDGSAEALNVDYGSHDTLRLSGREPVRRDSLSLLLQVRRGAAMFRAVYDLQLPATAGARPLSFLPASGIYAGQTSADHGSALAWKRGSSRYYGPVGKDQTLSTVAADLSSRLPMPVGNLMLALYEANPKAFERHNPRRLRDGSLLQVPTLVKVDSEPSDRVRAFRTFYATGSGQWRPQDSATGSGRLAPLPPPSAGVMAFRWLSSEWGTTLAVGFGLLLLTWLHLWLRPRTARLRVRFRRVVRPRRVPPAPDLHAAPALGGGSAASRSVGAAHRPPPSDPDRQIRQLFRLVQADPQRIDLRWQLAMRLHHAHRVAEFVELAEALKPRLKAHLWEHLRKMGAEIAPLEPLFFKGELDTEKAVPVFSPDDPAIAVIDDLLGGQSTQRGAR